MIFDAYNKMKVAQSTRLQKKDEKLFTKFWLVFLVGIN
jgi:hypothetical protein